MQFTLYPQKMANAAGLLSKYRMTPDQFTSDTCMKLCEEQPFLISYPELMHLMDQLRIGKKIDTMILGKTLSLRHAPILTEMLYQYWQDYPTDSKIDNLCRTYLQSIEEPVDYEAFWRKWLGVSNALLGCSKTIFEQQEERSCTWEEVCTSFGIQTDKPLYSYIKNLQWCFRKICCTDAELLLACKGMRPSELKILQSNLFTQMPLLGKEGKRLDHSFYTEQYPLTTAWLIESQRDTQEEAVLQLLKNYMIAAQIPNEKHRHFWENHFLQTRRNWKELYYQHHREEQVLEICGTQHRCVLDFYAEEIVVVVQENYLQPAQRSETYIKLSESAPTGSILVIRDEKWRSQLEKIQF